jgi:hypothetical protein
LKKPTPNLSKTMAFADGSGNDEASGQLGQDEPASG